MKLSMKLLFGAVTLATSATAFNMYMAASPDAGTKSMQRRAFLQNGAVAASTALVAGVGRAPIALAASDDPYADFETTESGLRFKVTKEGTGETPPAGTTVKAHYTGWLDGFDSEKKFDSSRDRGRPFSFKVGAGQVIRGWDESFSVMKVGEKRQVIIPPRLGYGDRGAGGVIPGGATLYFDMELLAIL
uniref:peptidylprolyl isomerase n=1 Tax=Eucampia antarctica TaxID=49252 RepID=A0A7S2R5E6_9STRA|mmetsp:Transcript_17001/g.16415  ORF Transcript_17001/g.16415 Transcript_17001/m.16415 type:complete len:189 (+) Transcript_17001:64-630(+)|eukprot:CAMPEP_0197833070 /NCGR_PEP_ID=MMETSP1437-20131217/17575_1 /TAXON_ID=49252 ORGANISM="Eucampia antarctica, Strain CCMP1452" /NCGR_SAMPLE_ID=MMETSP1437 /ASSEMBLY_ACC=CAM_ASM_001096 /LENGTH=188 /DNA_ID=CAMNT_0043436867 /DNA_START=54 /DNA_END=620 /DNA_ORIENTATION=+